MDKAKKGKKGEELGVNYLKEQGYQILKRNWRFGRIELDVIARTDDLIVVVEIKTRLGIPVEEIRQMVDLKKQRSIIRAANGYMQQYTLDDEVRFDIILVELDEDNIRIDHIKDAFQPLA